MAVKHQWEENARQVSEYYGMQVDMEERFYICPCCGEPIYESDWSENELGAFFCPICEDNDDEDLNEADLECGFDPYEGGYTYDC